MELFKYLALNKNLSSNLGICARDTIQKRTFESYFFFRSAVTKPYDSYIHTLKNLSENANLLTTKPDKGIEVVILVKTTYLLGMDVILSVEFKFAKMENIIINSVIMNQEKRRFVSRCHVLTSLRSPA